MRPVPGSALVAMVDPGPEVTKVSTVEQPRVTTRPARRSGHGGHHSVESQPSRRTARMRAAYVRAFAVRAGELSLCVQSICMASAGGAYALALLAIGALGECVSLSDKTKPGR
jgi:hypothetical protein